MSSVADPAPFEPVVLAGDHVVLEPLDPTHRDGIARAIRDGELWKLFVTRVPHPDRLDEFYAEAERNWRAGEGLAFATLHRASGTVIGSTRFMKASVGNGRAEIGFTFLARSHQRTAANTEAKLLMLRHAFETLRLNRVELLTDFLNGASRAAIERLGARLEGIMRSHMIMADGRIRDTALYSIVRGDWPGVEQKLRWMLARRTLA
jgi:RimJ/RimL family protein N-acetyltransferase